MPQVSVVMPVYNREGFVAEAIESILQQTFSDFEFIIVDDGSTDGSAAIIQEYMKRDSRIRFLQHSENKGVAEARNTGIAQATCDLVTGMDSDDVSLPQRLEKQVVFLESQPDIGAVGISYQLCDEHLRGIATPRPPARSHAIILNLLLYARAAMTYAPLMIRSEYLDIEPLYEPSLIVSSDADHVLRLVSEKNIRLANLPDVLYLVRRHENTLTDQHLSSGLRRRLDVRFRTLRRLGKAGRGVLWFVQRDPPRKLSWFLRQRAKEDISRLIEAVVDHNWVDADDEPLLHAEARQIIESTSPRYWQMFLHWYRYRIKRYISK